MAIAVVCAGCGHKASAMAVIDPLKEIEAEKASVDSQLKRLRVEDFARAVGRSFADVCAEFFAEQDLLRSLRGGTEIAEGRKPEVRATG